jgi:hypothetical protein
MHVKLSNVKYSNMISSYIALLFVQPTGFANSIGQYVTPTSERSNGDVTTFVQLLGLGSPIAGNVFYVAPNATTSSNATTPITPSATPVPVGATSTNAARALGVSGGSMQILAGVAVLSAFVLGL